MTERETTAAAKPLVSFILFAYNQERYVRAAVEAALAQTYSPLEVILSDDGSSDRTFEIMQELAAAYRGPHEVRLNRVEQNRGLINHVNVATGLARGEWLVLAAGDDISFAERTSALLSSIATNAERIRAIYSNYEGFVDGTETQAILSGAGVARSDGAALTFVPHRLVLRRLGMVMAGATAAYHRDCFKKFDPIPNELTAEDRVLPFRAHLLGEIAIVGRPLVARRLVPESLGQQNSAMTEADPNKARHRDALTIAASIHDVRTAGERGWINSARSAWLERKLRQIHRRYDRRAQYFCNIGRTGFAGHARALAAIASHGDVVGVMQYVRMLGGSMRQDGRRARYR